MTATSDCAVRPPQSQRLRAGLLMLATIVAFYLPSSIGGEILRSLTIVALLLTCGLLAALALQRRGLGHPALVATALGMLGLLLLFTIVSPFRETSPGAVFIYFALALLYVVELREIVAPRALHLFFIGLNVVTLALGFATALDVRLADVLLTTFYNAFYRDLLSNMVVLFDKPVLTFATHSMAGFMIYLFFYMNLTAFRRRRQVIFLVCAVLYVVLLVRLTSTTGTVYAAVAVLQLAALALAPVRRFALPLAAATLILVTGGMLVAQDVTNDVVSRARAALVGDKVRGLASRYATDGLLAGNIAYLADNPLAPVGFGFSERLYYGDSGFVVNLLRGSVPLLVAVYGGLLLFLWVNLRSSRIAVWLALVVLAFEIGFTPLQYFRFVGFAPFMIAYFNSLDAPVARVEDC